MAWSAHTGRRLLAALAGLRTAVSDLRFPLEVAGVDANRELAHHLRDQLDDHLLPRVRQLGAPLLAVVGGSTGAGKSTLVNSLLRAEVTTAGVLRPTTRSPVLVHHPDEEAWFTSDRILPRLARATGAGSDDGVLHLVGHSGVQRGMGLIDAPDIDSVVVENRRLGEELLGAADLWVFVTTAARYADAVPWDLLAEAARRRAVVLVVLNRVEPGFRAAVTRHLGQMLVEHGLDAQVVVVPESPVEGTFLPASAVAELAGWLRAVAGDASARENVVEHTVRGAVDDLLAAAPRLAAAVDDQCRNSDRLRDIVLREYADATREVMTATSDGTMLSGEVLARWQEYVGTGELLRPVEEHVGTWRDRITEAMRGRPTPEPVARAAGRELVDLVDDAADRAAERAHTAWRADPAGQALLAGLRLSRASEDLAERMDEQVRSWQASILDIVSAEGADRHGTARALPLSANGLGAALMVTVFAHAGGLTAAEAGVADDTAVVAQQLLEAVFGDDAVRRLTRVAHEDLNGRIGALLGSEAARCLTVLEAADVRPEGAERVRSAVAALTIVTVEMGEAPPPPSLPVFVQDVARDMAPDRAGGEGVLPKWWRRLRRSTL